jgi:signal transduction histidine kinase
VLGAAELLATRLTDRPELLAVTDRIRRASNDATLRVSALLQLARARSATEREALELKALLAQEIERARPLLRAKPVTLELDAPAEVWISAPRDLAAIAIGNLIRNACQFTERGTVRALLRADALVVEDTGPGVPEPIRSRLFEPFVRGDASGAGTGLGLSIVKRVAEHVGWTIRLDDAPGGGSRFTLAFGSGAAPGDELSAETRPSRDRDKSHARPHKAAYFTAH